MKTKVKDVMTSPVVAVKRDASFKDMAALLRKHRISALPVVSDDSRLVGIVSEADLVAKEALNVGHGGMITGLLHHRDLEKAGGVTAGELMTRNAVTIRPDDPVEQAVRLMHHLRVKRLPVTDTGGYLVGIVSRTDVLAVFDRPDKEIKAEITGDVILREFLIDPALFRVTVADGVVTLEGSPETADLGHNLVQRIRQVQGVVDIRDELIYPPSDHLIPGLY
jgi:CBS domain-containing protein